MRIPFVFTGAAALALALAPADALAQGATPLPLAKAVVSDDVAKRTLASISSTPPSRGTS